LFILIDIIIVVTASGASGVLGVSLPRYLKEEHTLVITAGSPVFGSFSGLKIGNSYALVGDDAVDDQVTHAPPPGPCYHGLKNNISTKLMLSTIVPWGPALPEHVTHREVLAYIQSIRDAGASP